MELHKLKSDEIRGWEPAKIRETESEIRLEMANMRMDIYTSGAQTSAKAKGLRSFIGSGANNSE